MALRARGKQLINGIASVTTQAVRIAYSHLTSTLSATNVQAAIDELDGKVEKGSISVTADGVKTYAQLFNQLHGLTNFGRINQNSALKFSGRYFHCTRVGGTYARFSWTENENTTLENETIRLQSTSSYYRAETTATGTTLSYQSGTVPTNGAVIELYY